MHLFDRLEIQQLLTTYGYGGLVVLLALGIVGLPMPDETLLTFAGYLARSGSLKLLPTIAAGFFGSVSGITLSFVLGRVVGAPFCRSYGWVIRLTPERLEEVQRWYRGVGHWALFIGYFLPGVRHFTALVAGIAVVEWTIFARYAYTGGFTWAVTFILLGFYVGPHWHIVLENLNENRELVLALVVALLLGYLASRRTWRSRRG
jgi:membrane protein DedA with SNARE-associated domain